MHNIWKTVALLFAITFFAASFLWSFFGPINYKSDTTYVFIVPQKYDQFNLSEALYDKNLIKNKKAFEYLHKKFFLNYKAKEGGYNLGQNMNAWQILKKLNERQDLMWVNIFFCPRKEQVGEKLANILGWDNKKLNEWNKLNYETDYFEGVYYPDTYLIPTNETAKEVSKRLIDRFEEKISTLNSDLIDKNIKWTTAIKIASLIAREAAGPEDSKIISGIIWNRLNSDMRLQIDATMQYTLGKNENGSWWGSIDLDEKKKDSLYNSYLHSGLPPTPICSPNISFIESAINPSETDCIYYLHDQNKKIHCAKTYKEHLRNIKAYL